MFPLWEGWDEYAHFAYLQHVVNTDSLPHFDSPLSREIDESMRLAPLPYELRWIGPPYLTEPQWWALPESERADRLRRLAELPAEYAKQPSAHKFVSYEAQQPPLYYWLLSMPLRLVEAWHLWARVLLIRLLSMALASLAIPLTWLAAKGTAGFHAAALLAVAPGFAIDTCRIANDSLAIALVALLVWLTIRRSHRVVTGIVMGAALLAKAYLLALLPVVFLRRRPLPVLALAAGIAGWWYARNVEMGIAFSGWLDHVDARKAFAGIPRIDWFSAANIVARSFIWFGGWSFLTLKSWIYLPVEIMAICGIAGAIRGRAKVPLAFAGCFALAMIYGVLNYYAAHGIPNVPGWYAWAIAGPLALIMARGLGRAAIVMISSLALMDFYGVAALLVPFYAGLVERGRASAGQFPAALDRLHVSPALAVLWAAATLAIPVCCILLRPCGEASRPSSSDTS